MEKGISAVIVIVLSVAVIGIAAVSLQSLKLNAEQEPVVKESQQASISGENKSEEDSSNLPEPQKEYFPIQESFDFGPQFLSCGTKKEFFSVSHISVSELQNIVPLGNLNPSGHVFPTNHLYFHLKGFQGSSASSAKVNAPGDIWVTRIGSSEYVMNGVQIKDYKMDFTVCDDVRGYFIHMTSLSQNLLNQFSGVRCNEYDTGGTHYKNCEKDFRSGISVKAGEDIGTVGGSSDFGLADLRTQQLSYANPSRWYDDTLHRVCPLDYFVPDVKSQLYSLLGDSSNKRTAQPLCGEVDQDEAGTAQGVWFVKGTTNTYPEDPHIALVHDNINPLKGVFSIGASLPNLDSGAYYFDPKAFGIVNRDFKDVKPDGNIYCYDSLTQRFGEQVSMRIILKLTSSTTLQIEKQDVGSCDGGPWSFSSPITFER